MARWLGEHPQIYFSPVKEPFYFSEDIYQNFDSWKDYVHLFDGVQPEHLAVGEGSSTYLFSNIAVPKIEEKFENPRHIVMIRNPVDMAFSLHEQQIISMNENITDFQTAWRLSPERRAGRQVPIGCKSNLLLDYQAFCQLGSQLERLFLLVPWERVLVLVLDDIRIDARKEYQKTLQFLGVPDDDRTDFPVYNPAKKWRSRWQGRLVKSFSRTVGYLKNRKRWLRIPSLGIVEFLKKHTLIYRDRSPMSEEFRRELEAFYLEDVKKISQLLHRDCISLWAFDEIHQKNNGDN